MCGVFASTRFGVVRLRLGNDNSTSSHEFWHSLVNLELMTQPMNYKTSTKYNLAIAHEKWKQRKAYVSAVPTAHIVDCHYFWYPTPRHANAMGTPNSKSLHPREIKQRFVADHHLLVVPLTVIAWSTHLLAFYLPQVYWSMLTFCLNSSLCSWTSLIKPSNLFLLPQNCQHFLPLSNGREKNIHLISNKAQSAIHIIYRLCLVLLQ